MRLESFRTEVYPRSGFKLNHYRFIHHYRPTGILNFFIIPICQMHQARTGATLLCSGWRAKRSSLHSAVHLPLDRQHGVERRSGHTAFDLAKTRRLQQR